ncbi:MAG TPA: hypothetical protein VGO55_04740 [Allosphingosinicella sp.]|nr:hypothetical protein [Allosphingosinicella sp.]
MKAFVIAVSLFALSSPAFAQGASRAVGADHGADAGPGDARQTGDTDAQGERLICRSMATSSTTRMSVRRVCRTAAEWREISRQSRD